MPHDHDLREVAFWRRHAGIALLTSLLTEGSVLVYALRPGDVPNRVDLVVVLACAFVATPTFWALTRYALSRELRTSAFMAWSLTTVVLVLAALLADGGITSPLRPILFLVLLFPALAYPWKMVLSLGAVEIAGAATVFGLENGFSVAVAFLLVSLSLAAVMVTLAAYNRGVQERSLVELNRWLERAALYDGLTACLNRRGLDAALEREVTRAVRYHRPLTLMALDVDNLKTMNDSGGHAAGDEALRNVAAAVGRALRESDIVGRAGGDEFTVILPETGLEEAHALSSRIHHEVHTRAGARPVTVSIGIAGLPETGSSPGQSASLREAADRALFAAKHGGRDRTELAGRLPLG